MPRKKPPTAPTGVVNVVRFIGFKPSVAKKLKKAIREVMSKPAPKSTRRRFHNA